MAGMLRVSGSAIIWHTEKEDNFTCELLKIKQQQNKTHNNNKQDNSTYYYLSQAIYHI